MSSEPAIALTGVSKSFPIYSKPHHRLLQMASPDPRRWYREFHALRGVDLEIRRGETVGIVGRNGSGKSTLLQLICGTLSPTCGTVLVHGRIAALLELGAGFNPEFTGRDNVYLNGTILGLNQAQIEGKFDDIAAFADIGDFIDQPVKTYSSGMYVRLAFAVAINVEPEILVIDEALSVGDEGFQRKCFARIDAIRDAGATVLFVSHSAGTVVDLCDRAILLDQGAVIAEGTPKHVVARYQKLLYAPADKVEAIRGEILGEHAQGEGSTWQPNHESDVGHAPTEKPLHAYWDDGLVPSSTVVYENRGATIHDPHLETIDGLRVNVVVPGEEYVYAYKVEALRPLASVRCGMLIRSVTGIEVGGAATSTPQDAVPLMEAGSKYNVRFRFRCLLGPATYFLNAGVLADLGEGEVYVDRRIDVAMFRVMPMAGRLATGLVDLDVVAKLRLDTLNE